jgi:hypothetical protein
VNGVCRIAPFSDYGGTIPLRLSPGGKIITTVPTVSTVGNIRDIVIFKGQKWAYVEKVGDDGSLGDGWVPEKLVVCWMHA